MALSEADKKRIADEEAYRAELRGGMKGGHGCGCGCCHHHHGRPWFWIFLLVLILSLHCCPYGRELGRGGWGWRCNQGPGPMMGQGPGTMMGGPAELPPPATKK
jgi:hypothetical protein